MQVLKLVNIPVPSATTSVVTTPVVYHFPPVISLAVASSVIPSLALTIPEKPVHNNFLVIIGEQHF